MSGQKDVATGQVERRVFSSVSVKVRAAHGEDEPKGITGLAIPVDVIADIGPFTEEISRSAVTDALKKDHDVRGLVNHDPNLLLGRTKSGTMTLTETRDGLEFDIAELPTARMDIMESIQRGDLDANSFAFTVAKEEWDESEDRDKPHRTITQFERLFDVSVVTFEAYQGLTTVSARALDKVKTFDEERALADEIDALTEEDTLSHRRRQLQAIQAREAART